MKKAGMLIALSMLLGSTAVMADRHDDHGRHDGGKQYGREIKHEHDDDHEHEYKEKQKYKKAPPAHARAWGHESRQFKQGDYLPKEYRSNRYYVNDWETRQLSAPPVGYRWTEVDGKYLLVSMANNAISKIVYGR